MEKEQFSVIEMLKVYPVPDPLPEGWILKRSRSRCVGHVYYYNQHTGECRWDLPLFKVQKNIGRFEKTTENIRVDVAEALSVIQNTSGLREKIHEGHNKVNCVHLPLIIPRNEERIQEGEESTSKTRPTKVSPSTTTSVVKSILKNKSTCLPLKQNNNVLNKISNMNNNSESISTSPVGRKRSRGDAGYDSSLSVDASRLTSVRVLHILKKHRGSRRPSSWRSSKITISKETACAELEELLKILHESVSDPKELRATFGELARTESDCNTAKRGGDVGYFGRKKMQPAFEKASFGLEVGDLSEIVETSSGMHLILRLG